MAATTIALDCREGSGVAAASASQVCSEFLSYLRETHPDRNFGMAADTLPRIDLTVTRAGERSIGFDVIWRAADGSSRAGLPLTTAFFDRNSDETLRRRFYKTFLQQNPLPF